MILDCREGKVKSPGGKISEGERVKEEKRERSHSSNAEKAKQQLRWANAKQQREFRFLLVEAAEGLSSFRRSFLEGEITLVSGSSQHRGSHNKQQQQ